MQELQAGRQLLWHMLPAVAGVVGTCCLCRSSRLHFLQFNQGWMSCRLLCACQTMAAAAAAAAHCTLEHVLGPTCGAKEGGPSQRACHLPGVALGDGFGTAQQNVILCLSHCPVPKGGSKPGTTPHKLKSNVLGTWLSCTCTAERLQQTHFFTAKGHANGALMQQHYVLQASTGGACVNCPQPWEG